MTGLPHDPRWVRGELQARIGELLGRLGIAERDAGGLVTPRNPTRADRHPGSFVIWTRGDGAGAWRDYATDEHGDVYDLIAYLAGLNDWIDAYRWALDFLGLQRERGVIRRASEDEAERRRRKREDAARLARQGDDDRRRSGRLLRFWVSLPPIDGTPAATYLRHARRLPLDVLGASPRALRYAAQLDHTDQATGEVTTWPAMVAAMTLGSETVALHRTWLAPGGAGKAPVARPKKMIGPARGAAIRLWRGEGNLTPAAAEARGHAVPLVIGEGIETCLTAACARPDYRVWAAGSLGGIHALDWPACASAIVLLAEADWSPEIRARLTDRFKRQAQGRAVRVVAPKTGSDLNDWLRAA